MALRKWRKNRRGSVAFETAVVLPFLMAMIYGIVEVGRLIYTAAALNYAVERASRCAVFDAAQCDGNLPDTAQCYAAASALGLGLQCAADYTGEAYRISAGSCTISGSVTGKQVSIDYTFRSPVLQLLPAGGLLSIPLHAQSCFPI